MATSDDPAPRRLRTFGLIFLGWTLFGLFFASQDLTRKVLWRDPTPWWHFVVSWLVGIYLLALLAPLILWLGRRFALERPLRWRRVALHLAACVVLAIVHLILDSLVLSHLPILPALQPKTFGNTLVVLFVLGFHPNIVSYWLILGVQAALRTYRRYQEREKEALQLALHSSELKSQLVAAQLAGLKNQLQPHFLFNTLNAIMVLVRQQRTPQAEAMLGRLSDLLRRVLDDAATQEVALRRELEVVELYLGIEEVRFQDRLRVEIAAAPETLDAAVPHLGLQPIVENAIRHGIGRRSAAGRLAIRAARVGETLRIEVQDDGPGLSPAAATAPTPAPESGIGLANTRARLAQLYGGEASLAVENAPGGGAVATLLLPFRLAPATSAIEATEGVEAVELCS